jgi:hypothetical protein
MKNAYVISINDSQGRMQSYRIVASTLVLASAEARTLAGVASDAETASTQNQGPVDSVVD